MKKTLFFTFLLCSFFAFGQIKHLNNFWCFPNNVQITIEHQEKLKGKVRTVIYGDDDDNEERYHRKVIEYNEKGNIASVLTTSSSYGEGIVSNYDRKGNLLSVTTSEYEDNHKNPRKLIKNGESTLKYRHYQDSTYSIRAVLTVAIDDEILVIDADKINTSTNTREVFHLALDPNQTSIFLEDSNFIKKILHQKYAKLSFEREDVKWLFYQKWFYDKNNKPIKGQILNSGKDIDNLVTLECQYLTADTGIFLGETSEYNKFILIDGEAKQLLAKDFVKCSNEKYTYDKQGNWIIHSYLSKEGNEAAEKVKIKRKIEYYEE
jgi:hypothetical protein